MQCATVIAVTSKAPGAARVLSLRLCGLEPTAFRRDLLGIATELISSQQINSPQNKNICDDFTRPPA